MNFSSLSVLDLSQNYLSHHSIYSWMSNLSGSISYVDLSSNSLQGSFPNAFRNMASLSYLSMSNNQIEGGIPEVMKNLGVHTQRKLKHLDISRNRLNGSIPQEIGNLFNLNVLDLSHNQLTGTLPESIGRLSKLETLYLGSNHLEGIISEVHLFNLSMLRELDLSFNPFQFKISSGFVPPFQMESIQLANCKQGPQFPEWIRNQHNFSHIDMSRAEISDTIPAWFWDLSSRLDDLNFSYNKIYGVLPADLSSKFSNYPTVDLSYNNLEGTLPLLPPSIFTLNLSQNRFSGSLESLCTGTTGLSYLDVSDNLLTGQLPDCFRHIVSSLWILNLANNNLSGSISGVGPKSFLWSLNLRSNSFVGEFPQLFRNCNDLRVIDLGENKLVGSVPAWIGDNMSELIVLSLRSNELYGEVPSSICHMTQLQILDLSLNKINGTIPKCFNKLTAMAQEQSFTETISSSFSMYISDQHVLRWDHHDSVFIMWKGVESKYKNTLGLLKTIDISSNHLTGEIPIEITSLVGLVSLNLSRNFITGSIPPHIGRLHLLEFLDLSRNKLSGIIPMSLSQLTYIGVLDLSYNNLAGRIPSSTQLQSFDVSAYKGNSGLCGKPVTDTCPGDEVILNPEKTGDHDEEDTFITSGFYISLWLGFVFGFLGICGFLLLNKSWRHKIFKVDSVHHWLY